MLVASRLPVVLKTLPSQEEEPKWCFWQLLKVETFPSPTSPSLPVSMRPLQWRTPHTYTENWYQVFPVHIITSHFLCRLEDLCPLFTQKITVIMVFYISKHNCWIMWSSTGRTDYSDPQQVHFPPVLYWPGSSAQQSLEHRYIWLKKDSLLLLPSLLQSIKMPPAGTTVFHCQKKPFILWYIRNWKAVWPPFEKDLNLKDSREALHSVLAGSIYLPEK